ncbi:hypothetical protein O3M35_011592 [Rhynocoris fuscipes]|uniref:FIP-RBD domain-containing protein n=1 Tax=Rhynocoris fuscipes TaxID=488301 RepID=A0AAW1CWS8_9HEMI
MTEEETCSSGVPSLGHGLEYDLWEGQFQIVGVDGQEIIGDSLNGISDDGGCLNGLHCADDDDNVFSIEPDDIEHDDQHDLYKDRNGNRHDKQIINGVKNRLKKAWCADLNEKVQVLQEQMSVLTDNQNHSDERYTRAKQENATLQARVLMLEEQLREVELRAQEKLQDEERRHRELVARVDREKQLQVENCAIRLQSLELENSSLREEAARCRAQADKLRAEVQRLEEEQGRNEATIAALKEELETLNEKERTNSETSQANQQLIEELTQEIERLRAEHRETLEQLKSRGNGVSPTAHEQLQAKFTQLREDNRRLQEAHDEMQALLLTKRVEEGRSLLLTGHQSLAAELEAMSQDEVRTALKEQQEVNAKLRAYIDDILLNIVDNYPELLEVKGGLP